jgi:hypothetical protein
MCRRASPPTSANEEERSVTRDPLAPEAGARFLFDLASDDGATARYRAAVLTPDERFDYDAVLGDDGSVAMTERGAAAPQALEDALRMIARLTARSAPKKREDGLPPWPHRVLRWRGPGRG